MFRTLLRGLCVAGVLAGFAGMDCNALGKFDMPAGFTARVRTVRNGAGGIGGWLAVCVTLSSDLIVKLIAIDFLSPSAPIAPGVVATGTATGLVSEAGIFSIKYIPVRGGVSKCGNRQTHSRLWAGHCKIPAIITRAYRLSDDGGSDLLRTSQNVAALYAGQNMPRQISLRCRFCRIARWAAVAHRSSPSAHQAMPARGFTRSNPQVRANTHIATRRK
ncbi:MAG TPA: hypothetical protein PLC74_10990 [Acetobacteraceae bacterium]|nr:hypothetical protein [Acetobacteraceae bacterium]